MHIRHIGLAAALFISSTVHAEEPPKKDVAAFIASRQAALTQIAQTGGTVGTLSTVGTATMVVGSLVVGIGVGAQLTEKPNPVLAATSYTVGGLLLVAGVVCAITAVAVDDRGESAAQANAAQKNIDAIALSVPKE